MRLSEAPHFNESRQRRIPALAAAAETPALPSCCSPAPAPPPPRSPTAPAAPSPVRTAPGGGPERGHKDPRQRLSADRCVVCLRWGRELRAGPARAGPCRGTRSVLCSRRRGVPRKPGACRAGRAPPLARRRRHPARRSSKGAALRWPDWPRPGAVCTGGSRAAGTCLFCLVPPGLKREIGRAPSNPLRQAFRHVVSGDGEPGRRSWARCLSLSELAAEGGPSLRLEGVAGPGLLLCVCFLECPGGWCA